MIEVTTKPFAVQRKVRAPKLNVMTLLPDRQAIEWRSAVVLNPKSWKIGTKLPVVLIILVVVTASTVTAVSMLRQPLISAFCLDLKLRAKHVGGVLDSYFLRRAQSVG